MKTILFSLILLVCGVYTYAQNTTYEYVPGVIAYDAIAYDANGDPLSAQQITLRASILRSTTAGLIEYQEIHSITTNDEGYFMIMIGEGTWTAGEHATIEDIPWGEYEFILKMEMDAAGGYNFGDVAANQFCSVPYSFRAAVSDSLSGVDKQLLISAIEGSGGCPCTLQDAYDNGNLIQINNTSTHILPVWIESTQNNVLTDQYNFISDVYGRNIAGVFRYLNTGGVGRASWFHHEGAGDGNLFTGAIGSGTVIRVSNAGNSHAIHSLSVQPLSLHAVIGEAYGSGNAGKFMLNNSNSNEASMSAIVPVLAINPRAAETIIFEQSNAQDVLTVRTDGLGRSSTFLNNNTANNANVIRAESRGNGDIIYATSSGTAGISGIFETSNANNNNTTLFSSNSGLGITKYIATSNSANAADALLIRHGGVGRGASIFLGVPSNPSIGLYATTRGTGQTAYFTNGQSTSNNNVLEVTQSGAGNVIRAHTSVAHPYLSNKHLVNLTVNNTNSHAHIIAGSTNAQVAGVNIVKTNSVGIGAHFAILNNSNISSALMGTNYNTTGTQWNAGIGVHGASAGNGTAFRGYTHPNGNGIGIEALGGLGINGGWAGYFRGNVRITGDLIVDGNKNAIIMDNQGIERVVFCEESPEVWFNDYGMGQLVNGNITINIASDFLDIITPQNNNYLVFIQLEDECGNGVKVVNKTSTTFEVVALNQVTDCNAQFSYQIKAKRSGMENLRMTDLNSSRQASENYLQAKRPDLINKRTTIYNELDAYLLENANFQLETPEEINIPEGDEPVIQSSPIIPRALTPMDEPTDPESIEIPALPNGN